MQIFGFDEISTPSMSGEETAKSYEWQESENSGTGLSRESVAVDVLSARSDVRVCRKRTFDFLKGLYKINIDDD